MFPRLVLRSLRARAARSLLALLAVTLGTGVATALATLALQVGDDLARDLRAAGPNFVVRPEGAAWAPDLAPGATVPRAGLTLPDTTVRALKRTFWRNNLLAATPELDLRARLGGAPAAVTGAWFAHDVPTADGPWRTGLAALRPHWTLAGRWPAEGAAEIALGRGLARALGARPGDALALVADGRGTRLRVSGVVAAGGTDDRRAWVPLPLAQALAGRPGQCDRVLLSALVLPEPNGGAPDRRRDPSGYERFMCSAYPVNVARGLAEPLTGAEVVPMVEVVAGEAQVVGRLHLLMLLLALAALTACTLGLLSTTAATVAERAGEFGLMRALGAGGGQITALLLAETLTVALAGGALGWAAGTAAAAAIRGDAFARPAAAQPLLLPVALALAAAVALAGTLGPLRAALRLDPVEVLRG